MSNPSLATEAAAAPQYPYLRFNNRERKLLASVKDYVDAQVAAVTPAAKVFATGTFTTAGGSTAETITVVGALSTDRAFLQIKAKGATPRSIVAAAAAAGQINVTMSGDASTDHVICWQLLR